MTTSAPMTIAVKRTSIISRPLPGQSKEAGHESRIQITKQKIYAIHRLFSIRDLLLFVVWVEASIKLSMIGLAMSHSCCSVI
jgi:hypothetical protein